MTLLISGTHPHNIHPPKRVGDVGYDLLFSEQRSLSPLQCSYVRTGVRLKLPDGYWAEIYGRSSTMKRYGIMVVHSVIDNGYVGEITVGLQNMTGCRTYVTPSMRLAQLVLHKAHTPTIQIVSALPETERGELGFGSTGT